MGAFAIYLLHIERSDGLVSHYCGSTKLHRFQQRMEQHARGHSSTVHRTYEAYKSEIWCVRRWTAPTRDLEAAIHDVKAYEAFCPVCNPSGGDQNSDDLPPFQITTLWKRKPSPNAKDRSERVPLFTRKYEGSDA